MFNKKFYEENKIQLTPYLEVPKYYLSLHGKIYETCGLRNLKFRNLRKGIILSPYEEEFNNWYKGIFDREIILPIENREYYNFLLDSVGITNPREINKGYISLDFFNSKSSLNIEIDSIGWHSNKQVEDFVRDTYLHYVFGITTLRFYYDSFKTADDIIQKKLKTGTPIGYLSFPKTSEILFDYKFSLEIDLMKRVYSYESVMKYFGRKGIILTLKDLYILRISFGDINRLKQFCEKYYEQEIEIIPNSIDYILKEAFQVIDDKLNFKNKIPNWAAVLKRMSQKNMGFGAKELFRAINKFNYTWTERLLIT